MGVDRSEGDRCGNGGVGARESQETKRRSKLTGTWGAVNIRWTDCPDARGVNAASMTIAGGKLRCRQETSKPQNRMRHCLKREEEEKERERARTRLL